MVVKPVFSHGQLYVTVSRVTFKKGLKILILDEDGKRQEKTKNVVFQRSFQQPLTNEVIQEVYFKILMFSVYVWMRSFLEKLFLNCFLI